MASRGFILIAMGKPLYGRLAYNLANSIKSGYEGKDYPITLYYKGEVFRNFQNRHYTVFDEVKEIPEELSYYGGKLCPFLTKLSLYDLLPYEQNIYLDVDTICFEEAKYGALFQRMEREYFCTSFTHIVRRSRHNRNTFEGGVHIWLDPLTLSEVFPELESFPVVCTSFMYLAKNEATKKLLEKAVSLYKDVWDKKIILNKVEYRNQIADEPILSIALGLSQYKASEVPYTPITSPEKFTSTNKEREEYIRRNYIGLTIPGEPSHRWYIKLYNDIVTRNNLRRGMWNNFHWDSSKAFGVIR
jgi:hypothetical protein